MGAILISIALRTVHVRGDEALAQHVADVKRGWAACYRARHDIAACDAATGFRVYPDPPATRMQEKLDFLEARHLNLFRDQ